MARLTDALFAAPRPRAAGGAQRILGVLEGEGIGPEVIGAALATLSTLKDLGLAPVELRRGTAIGHEAARNVGRPLSEEVCAFCDDVFATGGAILHGPGGGRFVYDLRRRFDLFCKLSPLRPAPELRNAAHLKPEHLDGVDIVVVRENAGGVYQGTWDERTDPHVGRVAVHGFSYGEADVRRIIAVAARLARSRRGRLAVVVKEGGVPTISRLWRDIAGEVCPDLEVVHTMLDGDHAAYRLIQHARDLDVVVAPNLLGDVLSDLGAVLLGTRGLSYSGNYRGDGAGVYQTNHGAAWDLAGKDVANPSAQILSLAMLLRESFEYEEAASLLERALSDVWRRGIRTAEHAEPGTKVLGTRAMTAEVCAALRRLGARAREGREPVPLTA